MMFLFSVCKDGIECSVFNDLRDFSAKTQPFVCKGLSFMQIFKDVLILKSGGIKYFQIA